MKTILDPLVKLADHLDKKGFAKEANLADEIIRTITAEMAEMKTPKESEDSEVTEGDDAAGLVPTMEDDKKPGDPEADGEEDKATANLHKVQMRRRARRRAMLAKNS